MMMKLKQRSTDKPIGLELKSLNTKIPDANAVINIKLKKNTLSAALHIVQFFHSHKKFKRKMVKFLICTSTLPL